MTELHYELCEQCEKNMMESGAMTSIDELIETQAEMDFGTAISILKDGYKVARKGWNGKAMFIYMVKGSEPYADELRNEALDHVAPLKEEGEKVKINAHIDMRAADGSIVIGWLASQTDMLAEDWVILS